MLHKKAKTQLQLNYRSSKSSFDELHLSAFFNFLEVRRPATPLDSSLASIFKQFLLILPKPFYY